MTVLCLLVFTKDLILFNIRILIRNGRVCFSFQLVLSHFYETICVIEVLMVNSTTFMSGKVCEP